MNMSDVLAAVQKMEESLQRLKKVRGGATSNPGAETRSGSMSDDDKIRLQLYVDVQHLLMSMRRVGVEQRQVGISATRLVNISPFGPFFQPVVNFWPNF